MRIGTIMENMLRLVGRLLSKLPFNWTMSMELMFIRLIQLPIIGELYHRLYTPCYCQKSLAATEASGHRNLQCM